MTGIALDWPRYGYCHGCKRHDLEVRPQAGKLLCAACAATETTLSNVVALPRPTTATRCSSLQAVPPPSSLVPCNTAEDEAPEREIDCLLRMHAQGRIEPIDVAISAARVPGASRLVLDDFALIYGLRLWALDERPVPYACRWAGRRLNLDHMTVWRALSTLVKADVLVECGPLPARSGRRGTRTFLPADGGQPLSPSAVLETGTGSGGERS